MKAKNKKAFISSKTGNEGIQRILSKTVRQAGLILLFAEKRPAWAGLTSALEPVS